MKKLFLVLFFITSFCPFLFAEFKYTLPDEGILKEIKNSINQSVQEDSNLIFHTDPSLNANFNSVFHFTFTRNSLIESNNKRETVTNTGGCVAVALSKTWLLASGHCFWDETIKDKGVIEINNTDKIIDVKYTDFSVTVKNKHIKAIAHKLSNLYLLQLVEGGQIEDNTPFPYLLISSDKDESRLLNSFADGRILINRTVSNEDVAGMWNKDLFRNNFDPYFAHRNLMARHIKHISYNSRENSRTAIISGIIQHRAGDPMFYIENSKEYVAGFGDAFNIPDNSFQNDIRRTHKVTLFSLSDGNEILKVINTFDRPTGKIIAKNILFK